MIYSWKKEDLIPIKDFSILPIGTEVVCIGVKGFLKPPFENVIGKIIKIKHNALWCIEVEFSNYNTTLFTKEGKWHVGTEPKPVLLFGLPPIYLNQIVKEELKKRDQHYYQKKKDQGKPIFSLITTEELKALSGSYTYGLIKYNKDEWKEVKDPERRYEDAFWRHFIAYKDGDLIDEESGLPHINMAFWNLGKLVYFSEYKDNK